MKVCLINGYPKSRACSLYLALMHLQHIPRSLHARINVNTGHVCEHMYLDVYTCVYACVAGYTWLSVGRPPAHVTVPQKLPTHRDAQIAVISESIRPHARVHFKYRVLIPRESSSGSASSPAMSGPEMEGSDLLIRASAYLFMPRSRIES